MNRYVTSAGTEIIRVAGGRSNVFLVSGKGWNVLVDSGVKRIRRTLFKRLDKLGVSRLDCLLLTHSHFDHAGNAYAIRQRYNACVHIHQCEAKLLEKGRVVLPAGTLFPTKLIVRLAGKIYSKFLRLEPCPADVTFSENNHLIPGSTSLLIFQTPGHTTGSVCLLADNEIAIVGDTMFGVFPGSVFPPFADDPAGLAESWKLLLRTGCNLFLPAHGGAKSREQLENSFNRLKLTM